eukprot:m.340939 g.340939  ORF g.340939 m.340939 type:complete len:446 (-) comp19642_c0_seq1:141-1478(-)
MAKKEKKTKKNEKKKGETIPSSLVYGTAGFIAVLAVLLYFSGPRKLTVVRDEKNARMIDWIHQHGGFIADFLSIRDGKYGRGVFTEKFVKLDQKLYSVPEPVWFSEDAIADKKRSRFAVVIKDGKVNQFMKHSNIKLAVALEAERYNPDSYFKPYLDTLPANFDNQPIFWSDEQTEMLQSKNVIDQIKMSRNWIASQHEQIIKKLIELYPDIYTAENNTPESFKWSYYCVVSRVFDVGTPGDPNSHLSSLLPFIDLANHDSENNIENNNRMERTIPGNINSYQVLAHEKMKAGQEVLQEYKDHVASVKYLYTYGFLSGNLKDTSRDYLWLMGGSLSDNHNARVVGGDGLVQVAFLNSLADDENEAFELLSKAVSNALASYPTTLEEDRTQFHSAKDSVQYLSLNLRIRFKQLMVLIQKNLAARKTTTAGTNHVSVGNSLEVIEMS